MRKVLIPPLIVFVLTSCGKGSGNNKPSVATLPATNITAESAAINGNIVSSGGPAITTAGFQWDTTGTFATPHDSILHATSGSFSITIAGLASGTTWYVRAYATNSVGTTYANTIHFITDTIPSDYTVITVAGNGTSALSNGSALTASFYNPFGVAVSAGGVLFVGDGSDEIITKSSIGYIRRIGTDGTVSTFSTVGNFPTDILVDNAGNIYDLDLNGSLYKIDPSGNVTTLATGLSNPVSMDMDIGGNIYVTYGNVILRVSPNGALKNLPITGSPAFIGIGVDRANNIIYVSDGNKVLSVDTLGNTRFIAGGASVYTDGVGPLAGFGYYAPGELRVDKNGNIITAAESQPKVRLITPAGAVTTIAGNGNMGDVDGSASRANFKDPLGLTIDSIGNIFVSDAGNRKIKRITHK